MKGPDKLLPALNELDLIKEDIYGPLRVEVLKIGLIGILHELEGKFAAKTRVFKVDIECIFWLGAAIDEVLRKLKHKGGLSASSGADQGDNLPCLYEVGDGSQVLFTFSSRVNVLAPKIPLVEDCDKVILVHRSSYGV